MPEEKAESLGEERIHQTERRKIAAKNARNECAGYQADKANLQSQ
jgi:hypothetical protein